ncbi:MAG: hypothetical protein ACRDXC_11485 [Acidimicrobiales bacterium]
MGRLVDALLRATVRGGFRRGLAGEQRAWLVIAAAAYVLRRARRPDERTERIRLRSADRYLVTLQPRARHRRAAGLGRRSEARRGADGGPNDGAGGKVGGANDASRPRPATA